MKTETDQIFDSLMKIGDAVHRRWEISQLLEQNTHISNSCGSCNLWMTKSCPRELRHKVHCNELICDRFQQNKHATDLIAKNIATINALNK